MAFRLSPQADVDLLGLWAFVAADASERRADSLVDAITDACWMLSDFPNAGRLRPDFGPGLRSFPVGSYVIYYRVESEGVALIARVLHARRDLAAAWESEK
jgi:toxin ParE1/3/4